jgi:hypothetical protein
MDELTKQGQWWWPFLVPAATAILALFGSWFGTRWGKTTEHQQWLRNERVKVYTDFLAEIKAEIWKLQTASAPQTVEFSFPVDRLARIDIIGSQTVRAAALEYAQHKNDYEISRSLLSAEGSILDVPGPNRARITDEYAQSRKRLIELGENFIEVVRRDLDTAR